MFFQWILRQSQTLYSRTRTCNPQLRKLMPDPFHTHEMCFTLPINYYNIYMIIGHHRPERKPHV